MAASGLVAAADEEGMEECAAVVAAATTVVMSASVVAERLSGKLRALSGVTAGLFACAVEKLVGTAKFLAEGAGGGVFETLSLVVLSVRREFEVAEVEGRHKIEAAAPRAEQEAKDRTDPL